MDTKNDALHLLNCPQVFLHVLPPRPFPWCDRISQIFFQYLLHFVTFATCNKLCIPFDVYFYHLVIPCLHSINSPITPHEPILLNLIRKQKIHLNFASFLQFFLWPVHFVHVLSLVPFLPITPHFLVLSMLLILVGCNFFLFPSIVH